MKVLLGPPRHLRAQRPPLGLRLTTPSALDSSSSRTPPTSTWGAVSPSSALASGTVQVLYSDHVTIDNLTIRNNEGGKGPSTDGIDIDSSHDIHDALCLKAGRDADGLRVNRPTYNVVIRDSIIRHGAAAVTIGSETSGGFRNIEA